MRARPTLLCILALATCVASAGDARGKTIEGWGLGAEVTPGGDTGLALYYGFGDVWAEVVFGADLFVPTDEPVELHAVFKPRLMYNLARTDAINYVFGGGLSLDMTLDRIRTEVEIIVGVQAFLGERFAVTGNIIFLSTIQRVEGDVSFTIFGSTQWGGGFLFFF